eukprot:755875-Hanusia_phi.AAC.4
MVHHQLGQPHAVTRVREGEEGEQEQQGRAMPLGKGRQGDGGTSLRGSHLRVQDLSLQGGAVKPVSRLEREKLD